MSHTPLSAQQLYDAAPLGALVRFCDGAAEPPQRHRRKHAAWRSSNGTGRLVRKAPQKQALPASFTLHVGDFGTADVTVVKAYRVFAVTSPLAFAILDKPRLGQVALIHDDLGMPTLVHLADAEADAQAWLAAHPRDNARLVPAEALEPRTFTYLQDPGHGWLIVSRGDLAQAGKPAPPPSRRSASRSATTGTRRRSAGPMRRTSSPPSRTRSTRSGAAVPAGPSRRVSPTRSPAPGRMAISPKSTPEHRHSSSHSCVFPTFPPHSLFLPRFPIHTAPASSAS